MPHRGVSLVIILYLHDFIDMILGRLSLLTDLLQYRPAALFHKIKGGLEMPEALGATGDVISHLRMAFLCRA